MSSINFFYAFVMISLLSLFNTEAHAKNLGQYGTSFEVVEEGFIAMIKRRLSKIDIDAHQKIIASQAKKQIEEPKPVAGLKKTEQERSFYYDPTYVLQEDIYLPDGSLLHAKGYKFNPLEQLNLNYRLFFIDGREKAQIKWAKSHASEDDKLILIAGKPREVEEELQRAVYFDQFAELINKTNIKQIPAIIEQEGTFLKVLEVKVND